MKPSAKPEVKKADKDFADIPAGSKMLIATPAIIAEYIGDIPKGHQATLQQMRKDLAVEYGADYTCPVTAGIFLRIVAEHAYEAYKSGKPIDKIVPFWRIVSTHSPMAKKLSFGTEFLYTQRQKEGLSI